MEFLDGTTEGLATNVIADNLLSQVDEEGHRQMMLNEIIDHRKSDDAIKIEDGLYISKSGKTKQRITTKGWELCVQWKDGSTVWIALKDLKQSYPVETMDYAKSVGIKNEPAFAWWIPYTDRKRKAILSKVKSKYWQRTHKYGIRVPKSVEEALQIDEQNGNDYWKKAIEAEMKKINDAFKLYDGDVKDLVGYQRIKTHFIFDIKLGENFRRKARLVADGHLTKTPSSVTYSSVVS